MRHWREKRNSTTIARWPRSERAIGLPTAARSTSSVRRSVHSRRETDNTELLLAIFRSGAPLRILALKTRDGDQMAKAQQSANSGGDDVLLMVGTMKRSEER